MAKKRSKRTISESNTDFNIQFQQDATKRSARAKPTRPIKSSRTTRNRATPATTGPGFDIGFGPEEESRIEQALETAYQTENYFAEKARNAAMAAVGAGRTREMLQRGALQREAMALVGESVQTQREYENAVRSAALTEVVERSIPVQTLVTQTKTGSSVLLQGESTSQQQSNTSLQTTQTTVQSGSATSCFDGMRTLPPGVGARIVGGLTPDPLPWWNSGVGNITCIPDGWTLRWVGGGVGSGNWVLRSPIGPDQHDLTLFKLYPLTSNDLPLPIPPSPEPIPQPIPIPPDCPPCPPCEENGEEECPEGECPQCFLFLSCDQDVIYAVPNVEDRWNSNDIRLGPVAISIDELKLRMEECEEEEEDEEEEEEPDQGFPDPGERPGVIINRPGVLSQCGLPPISDYIRSGGVFTPIATEVANNLPEWASWFRDPLIALGRRLDGINQDATNIQGCGGTRYQAILTSMAALGFLERWLGADFSHWKVGASKWQAFECQTDMPTAADADNALLTNEIDDNTWNCWIRANNQNPVLWEQVARSKQSRFSVSEALTLFRRGLITRQRYAEMIRELGYLHPDYPGSFQELGKHIPFIQDLIRFMVRDVADPNIVNKFGLDVQFEQKWAGEVAKFGEWQGVSPDVAKQYWRAHWDIPSPTQLYFMYRRLRNRPDGHPEKVTLDDIQTALVQQDILPYWIPKLLAITFEPLTRIDTRRAYEIGVIGRDRVNRAYKELGYDDENAETLTAYTEKLHRDKILRSPVIKRYATGEINLGELFEELTRQGANAEFIDAVIDRANALLEQERRKQCVKSHKKRFMMGEFREEEISTLLSNEGLDVGQAQKLAAAWICERRSRGKLAPVGRLQEWFKRGIISYDELNSRLQKLGWDQREAGLFIEETIIEMEESEAKKKLREEMEAERKRKADAATRERVAKQAASEVAKTERAREQAVKQRERREDLMLEAANRMSVKTETELGEAFRNIKRYVQQLQASTSITVPTIIQAVVTATQNAGVSTWNDLEAALNGLAATGELPI